MHQLPWTPKGQEAEIGPHIYEEIRLHTMQNIKRRKAPTMP